MVKTVVLPTLTPGITLAGVMLAGVNEQVVPAGRLVRSHESVTLLAVPAVRVAIIVVEPGCPGVSVMPLVLKRV